MFESSARFLFFDYFRIPYRTVPEEARRTPGPPAGWEQIEWGAPEGPGNRVLWPQHQPAPTGDPDGCLRRFSIGATPVFARLQSDARCADCLSRMAGSWRPATPLLDASRSPVASIWEDGDGNVLLPFDPGEVMTNYWSERYLEAVSGAGSGRGRAALRRAYYRLRPAVPRPVQIASRRLFTRVQAQQEFPAWPVETALHEFYGWLFALLAEVAATPIPWIAPWPAPHSWALVLTHDVETAAGYERVTAVRDLEVRYGFRSSWNLVPGRYAVDDGFVRDLADSGFEVGVHGLHHDGRDLESARMLKRRGPAMRAHAERWGAVGFRSPSTLRAWELMPRLGFDYDSSYPDTDPYEPQPGGCCTWLPHMNDGMVELPITLSQDHTVFTILQKPDEQLWLDKAAFLKERGGMVLALTHPDYLADDVVFGAYRRFLQAFVDDGSVWRALPREISAWWRRRAASSLELRDGEWHIVGPAAGEGAVSLAAPRDSVRAG